MEMPAKTYNEKFESFLKILESDDRFDNVCKNFLEVFALHFMSMRLR